MQALDRRSIAWSVSLHVAVALAFVVAGCVSWIRFHEDDSEILAEFVVEPPGDPQAEEPPPPPPEPEPEPEPEPDDIPVPDPPKPEPPKPDPPKPEPPKKKPIEVSKKIVTFDKPAQTRPVAPPPKVETRKIGTKGSSLTEEEYRKLLDLGATVSDHTSVPADESARCAVLVRDQLYRAWKRPDASAVTGTPPVIAIDLSESGTVLGVELRKSSGSAALDDSAVRAARAVGVFRNLTPRFVRANKPLVIEFRLTDAR